MGAPVSVSPLEAVLMQRVLDHVLAREVPRWTGAVVIELHPEVAGDGDGNGDRAAHGHEDTAGKDAAGQEAAGEHARPERALGVMAQLAAQRSRVEAQMVPVARDVVAQTGAALLAEKGFTSVEELSATARRKWRAEAKSTAVAELQLLLGVGVMTARRLVGLSTAPVRTQAIVTQALERGEASLDMALRFWDRCGRLEADDGAQVADALFGTDPATAAAERLDAQGELLSRPWHAAEYADALEREALRREGKDAEAQREKRRRARAERDATMRVHDDGMATLSVRCPLTTGAAIYQRIERAARGLRGAGDPRTLAQLRADIASALLLHGVLPLPGSEQPSTGPAGATSSTTGAGDPDAGAETEAGGDQRGFDLGTEDLVTPADLAEIARILNATPPVQLQVVIPWDTLTGRPACPAPCCTASTASTEGPDRTGGPHAPAPGSGPPGSGSPPTQQASSDLLPLPGRGSVGQILGVPGGFVTPEHARVLAMQPGTTLARLLTDPADGRLIERSIASYRPDADMRRQVRAADVTSRAPGSRRPAAWCDLDHEHPFAAGGPTSETNLSCKDRRSHTFKTKGWWTTTMAPNRDVSWTTLLGQTETTRAHDYRQYLDAQAPLHPEQDQTHPAERTDHDDRLDLACQALYAALAQRGPHADPDDAHGATDHDPTLGGWAWVTHTNPDGVRRHGPPPHQPTVGEVLGIPADEEQERGRREDARGDDLPSTPWTRRAPDDDTPPF